jgi:hypothetical protein
MVRVARTIAVAVLLLPAIAEAQAQFANHDVSAAWYFDSGAYYGWSAHFDAAEVPCVSISGFKLVATKGTARFCFVRNEQNPHSSFIEKSDIVSWANGRDEQFRDITYQITGSNFELQFKACNRKTGDREFECDTNYSMFLVKISGRDCEFKLTADHRYESDRERSGYSSKVVAAVCAID